MSLSGRYHSYYFRDNTAGPFLHCMALALAYSFNALLKLQYAQLHTLEVELQCITFHDCRFRTWWK